MSARAAQLASRARRRVRERNASPDVDVQAQRRVVDAFLQAAQAGDFQGLLAVLDPDVVLRGDAGADRALEVRGAEEVARRARSFSQLGIDRRPALVNGAAGAVCMLDGKVFSVMAFTVRGGRIAEIDILRDPERLQHLRSDRARTLSGPEERAARRPCFGEPVTWRGSIAASGS